MEVQFSIRIEEERRNELAEMARDTGITAASIVRNALYEKLDEWRRGKHAAIS